MRSPSQPGRTEILQKQRQHQHHQHKKNKSGMGGGHQDDGVRAPNIVGCWNKRVQKFRKRSGLGSSQKQKRNLPGVVACQVQVRVSTTASDSTIQPITLHPCSTVVLAVKTRFSRQYTLGACCRPLPIPYPLTLWNPLSDDYGVPIR